ncbi:SCP2 sterol-binding domain-containing protein [Photobacterium sp. WH77]|uniref:ubiquinone biosynthesis accessory factor UbiJ n=1 Tax=unclassified Photobacterium TaxID=2628852 RepID=UPI001ED9F9B3|nr:MULTISPECIES: SCP2 sterol-binding domain-containing protein [unclassified Photobacterium]MCG2838276.1 SCP2 sterol-binding domain-containing protein [Photobacterium sp. WH77]MCG2845893.1 SCP2 sterol-binding domain-containing protein [Photobacterium sp. WH80]
MPVDALVTAVVETALNALLKDEEASQRRLARLRGKVISVQINDFGKQLFFVFSQQIDVLAAYEGEADCRLALSLAALPELREQANLTQLIKADKLALEGDIQLAQQFSALLSGLKPDVAERLSRYSGDVVAHTVVSGARHKLAGLQHLLGERRRDLGEIITEEWRLAPPALEIAHFADQVDEAASQLARLEARIHKLAERLAQPTSPS